MTQALLTLESQKDLIMKVVFRCSLSVLIIFTSSVAAQAPLGFEYGDNLTDFERVHLREGWLVVTHAVARKEQTFFRSPIITLKGTKKHGLVFVSIAHSMNMYLTIEEAGTHADEFIKLLADNGYQYQCDYKIPTSALYVDYFWQAETIDGDMARVEVTYAQRNGKKVLVDVQSTFISKEYEAARLSRLGLKNNLNNDAF